MAVFDAGFVLKRHPSDSGVLVVDAGDVAQPWPELPAQMERFLDLTFLAVRRDEAQVTECWCPDETVKQELAALGWPEMAIWTDNILKKLLLVLPRGATKLLILLTT